jgi:hypothetical protein
LVGTKGAALLVSELETIEVVVELATEVLEATDVDVVMELTSETVSEVKEESGILIEGNVIPSHAAKTKRMGVNIQCIFFIIIPF